MIDKRFDFKVARKKPTGENRSYKENNTRSWIYISGKDLTLCYIKANVTLSDVEKSFETWY